MSSELNGAVLCFVVVLRGPSYAALCRCSCPTCSSNLRSATSAQRRRSLRGGVGCFRCCTQVAISFGRYILWYQCLCSEWLDHVSSPPDPPLSSLQACQLCFRVGHLVGVSQYYLPTLWLAGVTLQRRTDRTNSWRWATHGTRCVIIKMISLHAVKK